VLLRKDALPVVWNYYIFFIRMRVVVLVSKCIENNRIQANHGCVVYWN